MKSALLFLFFAASALAEDGQAIKRTTRDSSHNKDGKPQVRTETTQRGKTRVLETRSEVSATGAFIVTARSYYFGQALVMLESDEDRDGFFETLVLWHSVGDSESVESFIRARDGSVQPVSAKALQELKDMGAAMEKLWNKLLPPKKDSK